MSSSDDYGTLETWWQAEAADTARKTAAKCAEYGSADLYHIGRAMATVAGWPPVSDDQAFELGVFFYAYGKITRAMSAFERGALPSDDTWLDLSVYAKMAQAHRAGVWPTTHP